MLQIKNIRSCRIIISDAGIKLLPGQVVSVKSLSPQTEDLIARGYLVRLEDGSVSAAAQNSKPGEPITGSSEVSLRKDYENLSVAEAIEYVTNLSDSQILRAALNQEKRKKVIDVINQRVAELG